MKTMKKIIILIAVAVSIITTNLKSQEWHWEWANTCDKYGEDAYTDALHSEFLNNIFCRTSYDNVINYPDTSFLHPEQYTINANYAISKYDLRGNFINALDLYTLPGNIIQYVWLVTDSLMNIYLCAPFSRKVFLSDTSISNAYTPYPDSPDVFLAKLSPDYELIWSGLIASYIQDDLRGMVISEDNHIYISCVHMANTLPMQTVYLGQDTSVPYITNMLSVLKIDLDGNLIWKKEIRCEYLGTDGRQLLIGENGLIYLIGYSYGDISVEGDTIHYPNSPQINTARFMTVFDTSGAFIEGYFFDWDIWLWESKVNASGDIYISGYISDTAVIGTDTIIVPEGDNYGIIGRFSSQLDPIWFQAFDGSSIISIYLENDNLIFITNISDTVQIADTTIAVGIKSEVIAGEFDEEGQLINIITSQCSNDMFTIFNTTDNCLNPIIGGGFKGTAVFGTDTITSLLYSTYDGFVAKLVKSEPTAFDLGPDTTACDEYIISGTEGFQFYSWNDSLTNQSWFAATKSGTYCFACTNMDGCWIYDTIKVTIHPGFEIDLGPDTTIFENENIVFTLPGQYESYLWSNSVTANSITIFGESYEPGTVIQVWVQVIDEPCIVSDTVYITIKSEFGVEELTSKGIDIHPNPFHDELNIAIRQDFETIEIMDLNGTVLYRYELIKTNYKSMQIRLSNLNRGVYLLRIRSSNSNLVRKLIKI